jgi:hypothetical protein
LLSVNFANAFQIDWLLGMVNSGGAAPNGRPGEQWFGSNRLL